MGPGNRGEEVGALRAVSCGVGPQLYRAPVDGVEGLVLVGGAGDRLDSYLVPVDVDVDVFGRPVGLFLSGEAFTRAPGDGVDQVEVGAVCSDIGEDAFCA